MGWLAAVATLGTGAITTVGALLGVRLTIERQQAADRRRIWWERFTWAAELALDPSAERRTAGLEVLSGLARSRLAGRDELLMLDGFLARTLDEGTSSAKPPAPEDVHG